MKRLMAIRLGYISDPERQRKQTLAQATGGSKPACKINGGIRSAYFTSSKTLGVTFATRCHLYGQRWVIKVMANTPRPRRSACLERSRWLRFQYIPSSATDEGRVYTGTFASATVTCPIWEHFIMR